MSTQLMAQSPFDDENTMEQIIPLRFDEDLFQLDSIIGTFGEVASYEYFDTEEGKMVVHSYKDFSGINGELQVISVDTVWYNHQGYPIQKNNCYRFENTQPLTPRSIVYYEYDENGFLNYTENLKWNIYLSVWEADTKDELINNENGQVVSLLSYNGEEDGIISWIPNYGYENVYTQSGLLEQETHIRFYGDEWHNSSRRSYSYDNELLVETFWESWDSSTQSWVNVLNGFYEYNENNQLTYYFSRTWNDVNNFWHDSYRKYLYYDDDGNEIQEIEQTIYIPAPDWINKTRTDKFWVNGMLDSMIVYDGIDVTEWVEIQKFDYEYDEVTGSKLQETEYAYNDGIDDWEPLQKDEYSYDYSISRDDLVIPYLICNVLNDFEFEYKPVDKKRFLWDDATSEWMMVMKNDFYFSIYLFSAIDEAGMEYIIYPNPVGEVIFVNRTKQMPENVFVEIFNISGQLQYSTILHPDGSVNVSGLKPGMYVVRVDDGDEVFTEKIIVQ